MLNKNLNNKINYYVKKIKAINYLGNECLKCKEKDIFKLSFHHRTPNEKEYEWDKLRYKNWETIKKELNKCDLLCFNCHIEYHYLENGNKLNNDMIKNRTMKELLLKIKEKIECVDCGYNRCIASLEFHHRNKNDKVFTIGKKRIFNITDEIINEIEKCDIKCKNCHIKQHADTIFFNDNYDIIIKKIDNIKEYKKINHDDVYDLFLKGKGVVEISKIFNVNKSTISTIIKKIKQRE